METLAVYPGRFHPFHKGHAESYKQLANEFGSNNTYLAISQKVEPGKSPFTSGDRAKMAMLTGIPKENIISVANPYGRDEYINRFKAAGIDPEKTILVFAVSKKDMEGVPELGIPADPRFSFQKKKDGSEPYLQPYKKGSQQPMTKHAYIVATDVKEFPINGKEIRDASEIRKQYANASEMERQKILQDLYGEKGKLLKDVFDNALGKNPSLDKVMKAIKPKIKDATLEQKLKFIKILENALNKNKKPVEESVVKPNQDYLPEK